MTVSGSYVLDADHGWMEIHPVTSLTITGSAPPSSAPPPAPAGCHPTTSSGNCHEPGEFCPHADAGMTGVAGDGKTIMCELVGGYYRWEDRSRGGTPARLAAVATDVISAYGDAPGRPTRPECELDVGLRHARRPSPPHQQTTTGICSASESAPASTIRPGFKDLVIHIAVHRTTTMTEPRQPR